MGAIVETREMHLSLQGWFPICLVPPGTHDTMTVGSKYLMSDSYLYAGVLVPTSLLSLAFFPRIFFLIAFLQSYFSYEASVSLHVV